MSTYADLGATMELPVIELTRPPMPEPLPRTFSDAHNVLHRHLRDWPSDEDGTGICRICRVPMPCTYRNVAANLLGGPEARR